MTLDSETQRKLLLEILSAIQIPGNLLDQIYELKEKIKHAEIKEDGTSS